MKVLGVALAMGYYLATLWFLGSYALKAVSWMKAKPECRVISRRRTSFKSIALAFCDIISLRRLMKANDPLWAGELTFHLCIALVVLRHLRYFMDPMPACIAALQPLGILAGYIMPIALIYILIRKTIIEGKTYVAAYNFALLLLLLLSAVSGLLLKLVFRVDLIKVKEFILGIATFRPGAAPDSGLFAVHFILFLILFAFLPTHVFSAPLTMIDARQRECGLPGVIHEK